MGPLVSETAYEKVARYRALADESGGERLLQVQLELPVPFVGPGLVRFASAEQTHPYQRDEIFGPEAALYPVDARRLSAALAPWWPPAAASAVQT